MYVCVCCLILPLVLPAHLPNNIDCICSSWDDSHSLSSGLV